MFLKTALEAPLITDLSNQPLIETDLQTSSSSHVIYCKISSTLDPLTVTISAITYLCDLCSIYTEKTTLRHYRPPTKKQRKSLSNKLQMRVDKSSEYQKMNRSICELYEKWTTSGSGITARQECIEKDSHFDSLINLCFKSGRIKRAQYQSQWRCCWWKNDGNAGSMFCFGKLVEFCFFLGAWTEDMQEKRYERCCLDVKKHVPFITGRWV